MYIFLGIIAWIATIIGSGAIWLNKFFDFHIKLANKGYIFDGDIGYIVGNANETKKELEINLVLFIIPLVNLLMSCVDDTFKFSDSKVEELKKLKAIDIMSTVENDEYFMIKSKKSKFKKFTTISRMVLERDDRNKMFSTIPNLVSGLCDKVEEFPIFYDKLESLDYTLDEVKELNCATNFSYRVGKINGKNVAIIGIPNSNTGINKVQFKSENYNITHTYEQMTDEEAHNQTFEVYPFIKNYEEKLQETIEKIRTKRDYKKLENNNTHDEINIEIPCVKNSDENSKYINRIQSVSSKLSNLSKLDILLLKDMVKDNFLDERLDEYLKMTTQEKINFLKLQKNELNNDYKVPLEKNSVQKMITKK